MWENQHLTIQDRGGNQNVVLKQQSPPRGNHNGALMVPSSQANDNDTRDGGAVMLAAEVPRDQLAAQRPPTFWSKITGRQDTSTTFWIPDPTKGECGLIEALYRRRSTDGFVAADDFLLVSSRPDEELARNFSNHRAARVNLALDDFKFSKTTLTLRRLDDVEDEGGLHMKDFKRGMKSNLPSLHRDDYFLVSYRDYSAFALDKCAADAKRESLTTPKFVERYFAVRVGQGSGVFIPLTAAQFFRGWELIQAVNQQPGGVPKEECQADGVKRSLTVDQFKSLGPVPDNLYGPPRGTGGAANAHPSVNGAPDYLSLPDPHPWDFSPSAIRLRWQKFMHRQYMSVGKLIVRVGFVVFAVITIRYLMGYSTWWFWGSPAPAPKRSGRPRGRQSQRMEDAASSIFSSGPRAFFDMVLGSSE